MNWQKTGTVRIKTFFFMVAHFLFLAGCHSKLVKSEQDSSQKPEIAHPAWVTENCAIVGDKYYFVGFGEGNNAVNAIANALIDSRHNALACVFGGVLTSAVTVEENLNDAKMTSHKDFSLSSNNVNWDGYTPAPAKTFFADHSLTKVYVQYEWPISKLEKEKVRIAKLNEQIEKTKALANEVQLKEQLIDEQRQKIKELAAQEEMLKSIQNEADKAVARLGTLSSYQKNEGLEVKKVISSLTCGITVGQFIQNFRSPDRVVIERGLYFVSEVKIYWNQYVVSIGWDQIKTFYGDTINEKTSDSRILELVSPIPIHKIYENYGLSGRRYGVCLNSKLTLPVANVG